MLSQHHHLVLGLLSAAALSCADELVQEVESDVCYSGLQWIGGKRGSPEMYPGRDCVGCHLDNDGPELMFGGTVYPYVESDFARAGLEPPTGTDCFGAEGQTVVITGGDGQVFEVKTNRAGNFFVEGRASDLVKPFAAVLYWTGRDGNEQVSPMIVTSPSYGGCAKCHTVGVERIPRPDESMDDYRPDEVVRPAGSKIGMPGYIVE